MYMGFVILGAEGPWSGESVAILEVAATEPSTHYFHKSREPTLPPPLNDAAELSTVG